MQQETRIKTRQSVLVPPASTGQRSRCQYARRQQVICSRECTFTKSKFGALSPANFFKRRYTSSKALSKLSIAVTL